MPLQSGGNVLAVRFTSGKASSLLALGGPRELRAGDFWSIAPDPFDPADQSPSHPSAQHGNKPAADIGSRLELFVDDFLVDSMSGGVSRRLHHPVPREIILTLDKPWEGLATAYLAVVQDEGRIRIYYNGRPFYPDGGGQTTCLIESADGIPHPPSLGLIEHDGSTSNNGLAARRSGHNFTPSWTRPGRTGGPAFKAVAYYPTVRLGAYASPRSRLAHARRKSA